MKSSLRHEIASKYRADLIGKSENNEVVDVSNSMVQYLTTLPEYVAPSVSSRQVTVEVHGVLKKLKLRLG